MRTWTIRVSLVALALALLATDVSARGRCGGRGGRRGGCGGGGCYSGGGYGGGCGYGGGYGGGGYCGGGYCGGGYGGYGGGMAIGGGCAGGVCYAPTAGATLGGTTGGTGYSALPTTAPATVVVNLPADAKLKIEGDATRSTSGRRVFVSPNLQRGKAYTYTLTAEVVRDGVRKTLTEKVVVRAGQETRVRIVEAAGTGLALAR